MLKLLQREKAGIYSPLRRDWGHENWEAKKGEEEAEAQRRAEAGATWSVRVGGWPVDELSKDA